MHYPQQLRAQHPWSSLALQQTNIARSLQPQQPIFANYIAADDTPNGVLQVDIATVVNLPVEIVGLDFGNDTYLQVHPDWVTAGQENVLSTIADETLVLKPFANNMTPIRLEIPLTTIYGANPNDVTLNANDILVESRILGATETTLSPVRPGFATEAP